MTVRTTINTDGSMTTTSHGYVTSSDYQEDGIEVQRGMGSVTVASQDLLQDNDLITINGVQMPVGTAREMGFVASTTKASETTGNPPLMPETPEAAPDNTTGHDGYDQIAADLRSRVEAGDLDSEEAFTYDLAVATVANADLTITEIAGIIDGAGSGDVTVADLDANTRQVAEAVEQYVTDAATKSAKAELGQEGFDRLAQYAAMSPTIDQALRQYASMRALGKTSDSWSDILEMAAEELGH